MIKSIKSILQISAVFIGTIVGAGLASGQELTQFFARYGYISFIGIFLCMFIYISVSFMIINLSLKYNINSYKELINLVNSNILGKLTNILTSFFMISGAAIILSGSGALIHQYFHISSVIGIILMCTISIVVLLRDTNGLIEINSIIVPCLIVVISGIFILYISFSKNPINNPKIINTIYFKNHFWLISSILYASFNTLSFSGVLVPLCKTVKNKSKLLCGTIIGAVFLTLLCCMINFMLINNIPYIYKYDIPLLYISNRFGKTIQAILIVVIWLEMFSTEVSNIYSVAKTIEKSTILSYKGSAILIILISIPISQIGFKQLITMLYPFFGLISFIFIIQCAIFYRRN
ncbi:MAG: transporter [Clostridium sp.]|nr:transporter [Clostridium sp.]